MLRSYCYCILISIGLALSAYSQNGELDSLKELVELTNDYKSKADLYFQIAQIVKTDSSGLALSYYEKIIELGNTNNDLRLTSIAYDRIGVMWYELNNLEKSTEFYFMALDGLEEIPENIMLIGNLNNNIGWNFQRQKDYERALKYYEVSKKYIIQSGDKNSLGLLLNNVGMLYKYLGRLDEALDIFKESLQINRAENNSQQQLHNISNIGLIYLDQEKYLLAIDYFGQALEINYQRKELGQVASNIHSLGMAYNKLGRLDAAEDSLLHALDITNTLSLPDLKHDVLRDLYDVCQQKENYKEALHYFTEYKILDDSLFRKGQYTSLVELEAKYKVSQQERTLQISQNQLLNQRFINTFFLGALIFAVVAIAFLVWIYILNKGNEKTLIKLNKEIDAKNLKIQANNQNLEITIEQRTKTIQDQNERLREFAFMNSHKIRKPLSSILGLINLLRDEQDPSKIDELTDMIDNSAQEMDAIIFEINQNLQD